MDLTPALTVPAEARIPFRVAIVGAGRLGTALAAALAEADVEIEGPLARGARPSPRAAAVLLCVPDAQIQTVAATLAPGPLAGHCSAATSLASLAPHEAFSLHPLMTVTAQGASFAGATAAIAGGTARALDTAAQLALALGMRPVEVADADRAAYHAAASIASNFLVTVQSLAERLAGSAGLDRERLLALVRETVENWAAQGAANALTGPIARGDEETVARQRAAVAERVPEELVLFDALTDATRRLAQQSPRTDHALTDATRRLAQQSPRTDHALTDATRRLAQQSARTPRTADGDRLSTVRTVAELRAALNGPRRAGRSIGLVPTMGALHKGHLSLIRRARATCDEVVVTLFVNPTQFEESRDLDGYPRDERRDAEMAAEAGADLLFVPDPGEVYPSGFATTVSVGDVTASLEGEHRGNAHFTGVATVVCKLLNMAQPDVAFFGQKDAQQVAVIRRLVRDLDIPVRIEVGATIREPDGLALSSRNVRLSDDDRVRARALPRALDAVRAAVGAGERDAAAIAAAGRAAMSEHGVEPEYLALVAPDSFAPVARLNGERVLVAVAARVGDVRLIDNDILDGGS